MPWRTSSFLLTGVPDILLAFVLDSHPFHSTHTHFWSEYIYLAHCCSSPSQSWPQRHVCSWVMNPPMCMKVCSPIHCLPFLCTSTEQCNQAEKDGEQARSPLQTQMLEGVHLADHILQTISALEHWWFHHVHHYLDNPDAQAPLNSDSQVKPNETTQKHDVSKVHRCSRPLRSAFLSMPAKFLLHW